MKIYKEIIVPESKREVFSHYVCDCCGKQYDNIPDGLHEECVTIEHWIRERINSETIRRFYIETDICSECFTTKVLPVLKDMGIKFQETDEKV